MSKTENIANYYYYNYYILRINFIWLRAVVAKESTRENAPSYEIPRAVYA